MPLPKLNRALLAKVLHHIEEEPLRFDMGTWAEPSTQAPCGTQACLAGWAYILSRPRQKTAMEIAKRLADRRYSDAFNSLIFKKAQKALGLTTDEARALFLTGCGIEVPQVWKQQGRRSTYSSRIVESSSALTVPKSESVA